MNIIKRNPVLFFILLAIVITYLIGIGTYILLVSLGVTNGLLNEFLMKFGPSLAGVIMIMTLSGKTGLKELFRSCINWRINAGWYLFALFLPVIITAGVLLFSGYQSAFKSIDIYRASEVFFYQLLIAVFLGGGLGEELGWRGFLFPELHKKYAVFISGVLTGVAWFAWHIPAYLFFNKGAEDPILPFLIICISISVIFSKLYFYTNRSLIIPIVLHASLNAAFYSIEELMPEILNSPGFQPDFDWTAACIWTVIAVIFQIKISVTKK